MGGARKILRFAFAGLLAGPVRIGVASDRNGRKGAIGRLGTTHVGKYPSWLEVT